VPELLLLELLLDELSLPMFGQLALSCGVVLPESDGVVLGVVLGVDELSLGVAVAAGVSVGVWAEVTAPVASSAPTARATAAMPPRAQV
jgi:hypothetical protein